MQPGQQVTLSKAEGIFLHGSVASLLAKADGRKNTIRRQPDEVTWVMDRGVISEGRDEGADELVQVGQLLYSDLIIRSLFYYSGRIFDRRSLMQVRVICLVY